jgi:ketosteroid isomerase-like protein
VGRHLRARGGDAGRRAALIAHLHSATLQAADLAGWIERYERAWRTPGTAPLAELFTDAATYSAAPFQEPRRGREEIARLWEAEREGADEVFDLSWESVAVQGNVGVARVEVRYAGPPGRVYRDIWIVELDEEGRCLAFEEWPFFPGQPLAAPD